MKDPRRQPMVEALEGRALLSTVHGSARPAARYIETYRIRFEPLNGSGVLGTGTLQIDVRNRFGDNPATLTLRVRGLERGYPHAVTLNGFDYLMIGRSAAIPPASAASADPSPAGLGPSTLSDGEGQVYYGAPQGSAIPPIRPARAGGVREVRLRFADNYDARTLANRQAIILHGLSVDGQRQADAPAAFGSIRLVRIGRG